MKSFRKKLIINKVVTYVKYILSILLLIFTADAFAQQEEKPLVQFSGIVYNAMHSDLIVPYVSITNISNHNQVNISNYKGYFSFVVHEQDTLTFTSIGFASFRVVIPAHVSSKSYTLPILLKPEIANLPALNIFPWATTDEFKKDFLTMKLADDDLEIARKNIEHSILSSSARDSYVRDGKEIHTAWAQYENANLQNQHSLTPNPLLNPIAWGTLIKQISDGDKSRVAEGSGN